MRICTIEGCQRKHKANGLCAKHRQEARRREKGIEKWKPRAQCSVAGCEFRSHAEGYCTKHYQNWKRNGDPLPVRRAPNGAGSIDKVHGYRMVWFEGKQRREHDVVMERKLGRRLRRGEVVHHRNEIKTDNDPDNLVLYGSQSEHAKHHYESSTSFMPQNRRRT